MSGSGMEQGAFGWPAESAREGAAERLTPEVVHPEAPPADRGGGARAHLEKSRQGPTSPRGARFGGSAPA